VDLSSGGNLIAGRHTPTPTSSSGCIANIGIVTTCNKFFLYLYQQTNKTMKVNRLEEKKKYPSELNTKAVACRVPIEHYIEFLKEATEMKISMADWVLMKIYEDNALGIHTEAPTMGNSQKPEGYITLKYDDVVEYLIEKGYDKYDAKRWAKSFGCYDEDVRFLYWKDWIDMEEQHITHYENLMTMYDKAKEPNLLDIKARIDKLLKQKKDLTLESRKLHIRRISEALKILEGL
jgi:hypothetical protein